MRRKRAIKNLILILFLILFLGGIFFIFFKNIVLASSTDGTINSTYRYAWGENIGWIDFGTANGNVHVTDSGLSGYALSETIGWIYLGDIVNDGAGNLSGYAWSENAGWITFNPTNGGVTINSSGEWSGSALGENIGWIIFSGDYKVKTDWRPQSTRPACNNAIDDDGDGKIDYPLDLGCSSLDDTSETDGGGGLPFEAYSLPTPPPPTPENPQGEFSILIQNGAAYTNSRTVALKLNGGPDTTKMAVSNTGDFSDASQDDYQTQKEWDLCSKISSLIKFPACPDGTYTIYATFYTQYGQSSKVASSTIILDTLAPEIKITENKNYYSTTEDVVLIGETEPRTEIILDWNKNYSLFLNDQGKLTINLGKLPAGEYKLQLTPKDLAGNIGKSLIVNLIIKTPPEVSKKAPEVVLKTPKDKFPLPSKPNLTKPISPKLVKQSIKKPPEITKPLTPEVPKPEAKEETPKETIIPEELPVVTKEPQKQLSEGYVYEKDGSKEVRIAGATVSIFWLNPETKQYELWPAKAYQQKNPQLTDIKGIYSFLVSEGSYYLKVEAPNYLIYSGEPFQIIEGSDTHFNIELKTKDWKLKLANWQIILLSLVVILLFGIFFGKKIIERLSSRTV